jgi:hypothetical protein
VVDRGNERVTERTARFAGFQGGKAGHQVHDQIGRAWAVGLLDGRDVDAAILRDKGREYGQLYWGEYAALAPGSFQAERRSRGVANDVDDPMGQRFAGLDLLARSVGHDAFTAMHGICVDEWWFPDSNKDWVDRLINTAMVKAGRPVAGEIERRGDDSTLALALDALVAMVGAGTKSALRRYRRA